MDEVIAQEIINHQSTGIMFHSGLVDAFIVLELPKLEKIQRRQLLEEVEINSSTKKEVYKATGKIMQSKFGVPAADLTIKAVSESNTERMATARKCVRKWRDWEVKTIALYAKACQQNADCKLWIKLRRNVEKEIKNIDRILCKIS